MGEENDRECERSAPKNSLLKIVILGDGGVGKSCLMSRFISNHFDDHSFHTIGVEFMNKTIEVNGKQYTLQVWDTAGQERFKSLRTPFYRGSDVCILAYSVDDRSSFQNVKMWLNEFLHYAGVKNGIEKFPFMLVGNKAFHGLILAYSVDDRSSFQNVKMWLNEFLHYAGVKNGIEKFPFMLVGNKSDVPAREREVTHEQLRQWCADNKIGSYIETSAKNDNNVVEAFTMAVQRWVELEQVAEKEMGMLENPDSLTLHGNRGGANIRAACCSRFSDN